MKKTSFGFFILLLIGCSTDKALTTEEQLKKDVATIDKYLTDNNITAQTDPSGLRYVVTSPGPAGGVKPIISSTISVKYVGKLMSTGVVFDQRTTAISFPLAGLIDGWVIGFQLLTKGSKATLYVPSGLGYKTAGSGSIPPNANLIFDVELIDVK